MPGFATHICCEGACQTNLKTLPTPRAAHHLSLPSRNPCLVFSRAVHGVLETRVLEPTVDPTKVHHLRNFFCKFHCGTSLLVPFLQPWNIVKTWCEHFWNWSSEGRFSIEQKLPQILEFCCQMNLSHSISRPLITITQALLPTWTRSTSKRSQKQTCYFNIRFFILCRN